LFLGRWWRRMKYLTFVTTFSSFLRSSKTTGCEKYIQIRVFKGASKMRKKSKTWIFVSVLCSFFSFLGGPAFSDDDKTLGPLWSLIISPPDIIPNPRPTIGMNYADFAAMALESGYGLPVAVTQANSQMIYTLPRQREIYFWFHDHHLFKITRRTPDDQKSWIFNQISPSASIAHPAF